MKKNKTQFTINLVKTDDGYLFDSLVQGNTQPSKSKKPKTSSSKNSSNRSLMHRIARQLALDLQQTPNNEAQPSVPQEEPQFNRNQQELQMNQQIEVENKREDDLPECPAEWFDFQKINEVERASFPQFFDAKSYKSPQLYMKYRNFIINMYRKNPGQYLTKISCRRILRGDANTIMKLHSFLQKKGLINYCVSLNGNYLFMPSKLTKETIPLSNLYSNILKVPEEQEKKVVEPVNKQIFANSLINKSFSKTHRGWCLKCQNLCGIVMYKKKTQDKDQNLLCLDCYQTLSDQEAQNFSRTDIVKRGQEISLNKQLNKSSVWGYQQNMRLLDFMGEGGETWKTLKQEKLNNKRNIEDIILQFLQFPITNFDPTQTNEQPISVARQDYIKDLKKSYENSEYKLNPHDEKIEDEVEKNNIPKMMKLMCKKYEGKVEKMKKIDSIYNEELFMLDNIKVERKVIWKGEQISEEIRDFSKYHESSEYNPESEGRNENIQPYVQNRQQYVQDLQDFMSNIYN